MPTLILYVCVCMAMWGGVVADEAIETETVESREKRQGTSTSACMTNARSVDMVVILDASASVLYDGSTDGTPDTTKFRSMIDFVKNLTNGVTMGNGTNESQIAVIAITQVTFPRITLKSSWQNGTFADQLNYEWLNKKYAAGSIMFKALRVARESVLKPEHGMRPWSDSKKFALILTDGWFETHSQYITAAGALARGLDNNKNTDRDNVKLLGVQITGYAAGSDRDTVRDLNMKSLVENGDTVYSLSATDVACSSGAVDMVIILDASASILYDNDRQSTGQNCTTFRDMIQFVKNLTNGLSMGVGTSQTQIAVIPITQIPQVRIHFTNSHGGTPFHTQLRNDWLNDEYASGTNMHKALEIARKYAFNTANGMRASSAKYVLMLTDGTFETKTQYILEATKLRTDVAGSKILAVQVDVSPFDSEKRNTLRRSNIRSVVDHPWDGNVYSMDNYGLNQIRSRVWGCPSGGK